MIFRLLEYESKEIFKKFGIPLTNYIIIENGGELTEKLEKFSFPAIIKSQIAIGSRKKAGLIKKAETLDEALEIGKDFLQREVKGYKVKAILVENLVDIENEFYCAVTLDASERKFYLIASAEGGIDIEEVANERPEAIVKKSFSYSTGLTEKLARSVAEQLNLKETHIERAIEIFRKLWEITVEMEAQLVEINPLVLTANGLIAVDGKMILDNNAAFRQPITQRLIEKKSSDLEKVAQKAGFSFVKLEGEIGILANGAGLTMALLDVLSQLEMKAANFLDVGGGASQERVYKALEVIFKLNPKGILINIFGGITKCDVVAKAIIKALKDFKDTPPMVIRLTGTNEKKGLQLLKKEDLNAFKDLMNAVRKLKTELEK